MCGFIAQLVEQRTGNAEVTGSNPVEALIFFQASSCQLEIYCDDHSSLSYIVLLLCYLVTFLLCYLIALSPCYSVPFLPCYPLPLFPCYSVVNFLILVYLSLIDAVFLGGGE